jgi:hypothetical protein
MAIAMPLCRFPLAPDQSIAAKRVNLCPIMLSGHMEFEWDEDKRLANLAKHGLDFRRVKTIWDGNVIDPAATRLETDETRYLALGIPGEDEIVVAVVYTNRADNRRIISARRARDYERKNYQIRFGRGR